jgi:hypothetical protein
MITTTITIASSTRQIRTAGFKNLVGNIVEHIAGKQPSRDWRPHEPVGLHRHLPTHVAGHLIDGRP